MSVHSDRALDELKPHDGRGVSTKTCYGYSLEVPPLMSMHNMFLWRNKKNYPRIITRYASLTRLLPAVIKHGIHFLPKTVVFFDQDLHNSRV